MNPQTDERLLKLVDKKSKIRSEMPPLPQDGWNPHFKSKYTKLDTVIKNLNPLLEKYKLDISFVGLGRELQMRVLDRETGYFELSTIELTGTTAQQLGSDMTYLRRYEIITYFNLVAMDDDGSAASKLEPITKPNTTPTETADTKGTSTSPSFAKDAFLKQIQELRKITTMEDLRKKKSEIEQMFNPLSEGRKNWLIKEGKVRQAEIQKANTAKKS